MAADLQPSDTRYLASMNSEFGRLARFITFLGVVTVLMPAIGQGADPVSELASFSVFD
ncbi:MAG: hypothetical protein QOI34_1158, partial [Verrucomicrobiota bacterium]